MSKKKTRKGRSTSPSKRRSPEGIQAKQLNGNAPPAIIKDEHSYMQWSRERLEEKLARESHEKAQAREKYLFHRAPVEDIDRKILEIVKSAEIPFDDRIRSRPDRTVVVPMHYCEPDGEVKTIDHEFSEQELTLALVDLEGHQQFGRSWYELVEELEELWPGITIGDPRAVMVRYLRRDNPEKNEDAIKTAESVIRSWSIHSPGGDVTRRLEVLLERRQLRVWIVEIVERDTYLRDRPVYNVALRPGPTCEGADRPPRDKGAGKWGAPPGYVSTSDIMHDPRFQKNGKNPPRTTIDVWVKSAREKGKTVEIVKAPDTGENHYERDWVDAQITHWNPRIARSAERKT